MKVPFALKLVVPLVAFVMLEGSGVIDAIVKLFIWLVVQPATVGCAVHFFVSMNSALTYVLFLFWVNDAVTALTLSSKVSFSLLIML